MKTKHSAYYEVLEAFSEGGCPICRLADNYVRKRMDWLLYESVNDPDIRRMLTASRGFCARHSEYFIEEGSPLAVSIIYRDIIDAVLRDIIDVRRKRKHIKAISECVACKWAKEQESAVLSILVDYYLDEQMHDAIISCREICLTHLNSLLLSLPSDQSVELSETVLSHLRDLRNELSEIIRKNDYLCNEEWGAERDAWIRAVRKLK